MKNANISELRNHLSEYLQRVRKGETVVVLDRDVPIARLEPIAMSKKDLPPYYQEALKSGVVRPPRKRDAALRNLASPPEPRKPGRLVEALLDERRASR